MAKKAPRPESAESLLIRSLRAQLRRDPHNLAIGIELARELGREGEVDAGVDLLSNFLLRNPRDTRILAALGGLLIEHGRLEEAAAVLQALVAHLPNHAEYRFILGTVLGQLRQPRLAIEHLEAATRLDGGHSSAWVALAQAREAVDKAEAALEAAEAARQAAPSDLALACFHLQLQNTVGVLGDPVAWLDDEPPEIRNSPDARLQAAMMMPTIAWDVTQIQARRQRMMAMLEDIRTAGIPFVDVVGHVPNSNFYLGYHGMEDRPLMEATTATLLAGDPGLGYVSPRLERPPIEGRRLRIGFLSSFLRTHSVGRVLNRFLKELDRERFEVVLLELPGKYAGGQDEARGYADETVFVPKELDASRAAIEAAELDVLVVCDIALDPYTNYLAYSRLAPVQCTTWGHPGTAGRPSIDYWISCEDWEPAGNERLYTEKLVRFTKPPMIATRLPVPDPLVPRADLGLPEGRLYGCPQSLYKLHPEFDRLLGEVLRRDPGGHLVLVNTVQRRWKERFLARFAATNPDVAARVVTLDTLSIDRYLSVTAHSAVSLDPIHFGGANTSMEAFTVGTPVVTLPGGQLRNRQTVSFYNMMEKQELVVSDEASYVDLAVGIAQDPSLRARLSNEVKERSHVIFDTVEVTRELESFFQMAVRRV